ncbi:MAG: 3-dehydroquinate dehydratase [Proteobacteria bacterium]|nr:3-dehydroquinate dehydratase [Pseudomonadota bacterium]
MKILVANGVNLDLLGRREPNIYGNSTLAQIETEVEEYFKQISKSHPSMNLRIHFFQSNDEAKFLEELSKDWSGIVINAGAWTHTSLAIADRLTALAIPFVEVHISNIYSREEFRHKSFLSNGAIGVISGFGKNSYFLGIRAIIDHLILQKKN